MPEVFISIGSNIEPERHVRSAVAALAQRFPGLSASPVYRTDAEGFDGEPFLNLVVGFDSEQPALELNRWLRSIEDDHQRVRGSEKFAPRTLDLDLLLYGDQTIHEPGLEIPRDEILRYGFVLRPLADLAPELRHPQDGRNYRQLWQALGPGMPPLQPVTLKFPEPLSPRIHPNA